jgi:hypothetical protein
MKVFIQGHDASVWTKKDQATERNPIRVKASSVDWPSQAAKQPSVLIVVLFDFEVLSKRL